MGAEEAGAELVIGLVTPVGTRTSTVVDRVRSALTRWHYGSTAVKISSYLDNHAPIGEYEDARIQRLISAGNDFCERNRSSAATARLAVQHIRFDRFALNKARGIEGDASELMARPVPRQAYILHSLKRVEEVDFLRALYGNQFLLVGSQGSLDQRRSELMGRALSAVDEDRRYEVADQLMAADAADNHAFGQRVNKTYPRADYFLGWDEPADRFVDLIFGDPYQAPTKHEIAMNMAEAVSLQTLAASRRVGASIRKGPSIVAMGCNEVPPGEKPDILLGVDFSGIEKARLALDTLKRLSSLLRESLSAKSEQEIAEMAKPLLADSLLFDVIEYQRPVHAEMAAITDAARRGEAIEGAHLYSTTYPCHLCFKAILSSGLARVYYIDPYPKSRAAEMYPNGAKALVPYEGLHPRLYKSVFQERPVPVAQADGSFPSPDHMTRSPFLGHRREPNEVAREEVENTGHDYLNLEGVDQ